MLIFGIIIFVYINTTELSTKTRTINKLNNLNISNSNTDIMSTPSEPPPPYEASTSNSRPVASTSQQQDPTHLQIPHKTRSGIPPLSRRSMEDESRPLPTGWVRQYDSKSNHQFYVDTTTTPPRSIWHHPYDDDSYMSSLSPSERARIEGLHTVPSHADIEAESSMDDDDHHTGGGYPADLPPRQNTQEGDVKGVHKFGRKMKDKITNSTHVEREQKRAQREAEEAEAYRRHQHIRQQMAKAAETGQPQLLGKDKDGKDVYIEPPATYGGGYGGGYGGMGGGFGGGYGGGYGYNPYGNGGVYDTPNARYIRPQDPYNRPYGYGYGGGLGLPLLGGLGGGLLLGGLMF